MRGAAGGAGDLRVVCFPVIREHSADHGDRGIVSAKQRKESPVDPEPAVDDGDPGQRVRREGRDGGGVRGDAGGGVSDPGAGGGFRAGGVLHCGVCAVRVQGVLERAEGRGVDSLRDIVARGADWRGGDDGDAEPRVLPGDRGVRAVAGGRVHPEARDVQVQDRAAAVKLWLLL